MFLKISFFRHLMNGVFLFKKIIKIRLHAAELRDMVKKNKEIAEILHYFLL
jgi:hypothetical protein